MPGAYSRSKQPQPSQFLADCHCLLLLLVVASLKGRWIKWRSIDRNGKWILITLFSFVYNQVKLTIIVMTWHKNELLIWSSTTECAILYRHVSTVAWNRQKRESASRADFGHAVESGHFPKMFQRGCRWMYTKSIGTDILLNFSLPALSENV